MYKLIIVDDEEVIRTGLAELVNWEQLGLKFISAFEDGKDAIDFIKENVVDVIITDIRMSEVSGLEVAEYVCREHPRTVVAIVSGYKEFEYAKKAMEFSVKHYLLKPTKVVEIKKVFQSIKEELDKRNHQEKSLNDERERYHGLITPLQEQFFTDLVMGALRDLEKLKKRLKLINPEIDPCYSPCWLIDVTIKNYEKYLEQNWKYGRSGLDTALRNFFNGCDGDIEYLILIPNGCEFKLLVIYMGSVGQDKENVVNEHLDFIKDSMMGMLGIQIFYNIKKRFDNIIHLSNYDYPIDTNPENLVLETDAGSHLLRNSSKIVIDKLKMIVSNICEGNIDHIDSLLDSLIGSLASMPLKVIQYSIIDLFSLLFSKLSSLGLESNLVDYQSIMYIDKIDEIKTYSKKALIGIAKQINDNGKNSSIIQLVEKAKDFIKSNYQNDLSLESVADKVFLNPVYLSRMFKQTTGENFSDYLTEIRMQKAIELVVKKKHKINEIGKKVGYNSNRYFFMVFKKYTGCSPKEYLRKMLEEGG